jgi:hypothetical protein
VATTLEPESAETARRGFQPVRAIQEVSPPFHLSSEAVPYSNTLVRTSDKQQRNDQLFIAGAGSGKAILHHYPVLEEG